MVFFSNTKEAIIGPNDPIIPVPLWLRFAKTFESVHTIGINPSWKNFPRPPKLSNILPITPPRGVVAAKTANTAALNIKNLVAPAATLPIKALKDLPTSNVI